MSGPDMGEVPLKAWVFVMAPATWRRRFEDRGEAMDPGMAMGSIVDGRGSVGSMARRRASQARRCADALARETHPRAVALKRGELRGGSPDSLPSRSLHNLAFASALPHNPARCKIMLASRNTLETLQSR